MNSVENMYAAEKWLVLQIYKTYENEKMFIVFH